MLEAKRSSIENYQQTFLFLMQHFSNAGFPCPIMQSPSDHFLRAINTDFDRIIAMCKNWQVIPICSVIDFHGINCILKMFGRIASLYKKKIIISSTMMFQSWTLHSGFLTYKRPMMYHSILNIVTTMIVD